MNVAQSPERNQMNYTGEDTMNHRPSYQVMFSWLKIAISVFLISTVVSCDKEGRKKCQWVLEPNLSKDAVTEQGYVPACARNRTTMKQDCRFQITVEKGKKYENKVFRYVDVKTISPAIPRTISHIDFCK